MRQTWTKPRKTAVVSTKKAKGFFMARKKGRERWKVVCWLLPLEIHFTSKINTVSASGEDHEL